MSVTHSIGQQITFRSPRGVEAGEEALLRVVKGRRKRKVPILVEHCRPVDDGYLVVAQAAEELPVELDVIASDKVLGERREERLQERFRVMSPDIPNYSALAVDCSLSGLQFETTAPVPVGRVVKLDLGLRPTGADVPCEAEVVWCEPVGEHGSYRVGCKFLFNRTVYMEVKRLFQDRLGREPESVLEEVPTPQETVSAVEAEVAPVFQEIPAEEHAPLRGTLVGFAALGESATLQLQMEDGSEREIHVPKVLSLKDYRGLCGMQLGYLACRELGDRTHIRFLTPSLQAVLELETDAPLSVQ
jgi:hypothetical protein